MKMTQVEKCEKVLKSLVTDGPQTADEFISRGDRYVNTWAPIFTGLRQAGLVERTGEKRPTSHGSEAYVVAITDAGRGWLS